MQCLVHNLGARIIDWRVHLHRRAWRDTLKTFIPWFTKCTIFTKFRHLSHIDMNAVGSLKINKWHICLYTHRGSLHFKPSSVLGFNGRFNGVKKSDRWSVLGLLHKRPFCGSLRLRMARKSLYCERLKHQPFWQAYRAHTATSAWSLQWPRGWQMMSLWTWACAPARGLWSARFLIKNQLLGFVSYWNLMQYLEGVSGEWPCTKCICRYVQHPIFIVSEHLYM